MGQVESSGLVQCGRQISEEEIELICETVRLCPGLSLTELTATISEHLGWYTAAGGLKEDACEKLLMRLQADGLVKLPQKRKVRRRSRPIVPTAATVSEAEISGSVRAIEPVEVKPVDRSQKRLWDEYVHRYHPLGYKQPFGYRMRYFIHCARGRLGCVLFSGAAKALGARDRWIGWSEEQRLQRLAWVLNNSRYLIFPWVHVRNLGSHVLAQLAGRIGEDWENRWGYRPVLMESFVDPREHEGSVYKAAGWQYLGMTTGQGLVRPGCSYTTTPKKIFVKALVEDFRSLLCCGVPSGGGESDG